MTPGNHLKIQIVPVKVKTLDALSRIPDTVLNGTKGRNIYTQTMEYDLKFKSTKTRKP